MATRTIRFIGKAYSTEGDVSVVVNFNNIEVYSGTVITENSECPSIPRESEQLFTFTTSTDVTGSIPLTIAVTGGTFVFVNLLGNYTSYTLATNEAGERVVVDGAYVVEVAPVDAYGELNNNNTETDGKDDVVIDPDVGDGQIRRHLTGSNSVFGEWHWIVWDGSTLTCNFLIENTIIDIPTSPNPTPAP